MQSKYTQLYLHCVWATWNRMPLLVNPVEEAVYKTIHKKCKDLKCELVAIGGMPDHVHILVQMHPTISVSKLVKDTKGSSSHLITHKVQPGEFFKWQGSYSAFTVSKSLVPRIQAYINRQKEHHAQEDIWQDFEISWKPGD